MLSFQGQDGDERILCPGLLHSRSALYWIVQASSHGELPPKPSRSVSTIQPEKETPWPGARTTGPKSINPRRRVCTYIYRYGACIPRYAHVYVPLYVIVCWGMDCPVLDLMELPSGSEADTARQRMQPLICPVATRTYRRPAFRFSGLGPAWRGLLQRLRQRTVGRGPPSLPSAPCIAHDTTAIFIHPISNSSSVARLCGCRFSSLIPHIAIFLLLLFSSLLFHTPRAGFAESAFRISGDASFPHFHHYLREKKTRAGWLNSSLLMQQRQSS